MSNSRTSLDPIRIISEFTEFLLDVEKYIIRIQNEFEDSQDGMLEAPTGIKTMVETINNFTIQLKIYLADCKKSMSFTQSMISLWMPKSSKCVLAEQILNLLVLFNLRLCLLQYPSVGSQKYKESLRLCLQYCSDLFDSISEFNRALNS